jgi:hypothetical protein
VDTGEDAGCYDSKRDFDKANRAGNPTGPHMRRNLRHCLLDIIVSNLDVVAVIAFESQLARRIVECEPADLIDQTSLFCAAVQANLHGVEDRLLGRQAGRTEDYHPDRDQQPFHWFLATAVPTVGVGV